MRHSVVLDISEHLLDRRIDPHDFGDDGRQLDGPALLSDLKGLHEGETSFDLSPLQSPTVYAYGDGIPHHYFAALCVEISNINSNIACRELDNAPHEAHLTSPDELGVLIEEKWRSVCASRSQGQLDSSVQPYCRRCAPVVIL